MNSITMYYTYFTTHIKLEVLFGFNNNVLQVVITPIKYKRCNHTKLHQVTPSYTTVYNELQQSKPKTRILTGF